MKIIEQGNSPIFADHLDQHISSINSVVRVQLAQRRIRNNDNFRGGFNNRGLLMMNLLSQELIRAKGFRGGRSNWNNNNSGQGGSNHWNNSRGGGGFRGKSRFDNLTILKASISR